jgi:hypothetical protein
MLGEGRDAIASGGAYIRGRMDAAAELSAAA